MSFNAFNNGLLYLEDLNISTNLSENEDEKLLTCHDVIVERSLLLTFSFLSILYLFYVITALVVYGKKMKFQYAVCCTGKVMLIRIDVSHAPHTRKFFCLLFRQKAFFALIL